jgi:hypothetical protein
LPVQSFLYQMIVFHPANLNFSSASLTFLSK